MTEEDIKYMALAIEQSKRCSSEPGKVSPLVGAVVVRDGKILATAYRGEQEPGEHAEFTALEKKLGPEIVAGSTVYTTLEPCTTRNHPKVPCAVRLLERKVRRVVVGMLDPNPSIHGKGFQLLRDHNVAVDIFPPELMEQVEDLNRHFRREIEKRVHRREVDQAFVERFRARPLDDWYQKISSIYANRNFDRPPVAILAHFVEVIGGVSLLASGKKKAGVDSQEFIAKAIAWWFALCAKCRITSVSELLWIKYPGVCPYCRKDECDAAYCKKLKRDQPVPDWMELRRMGKKALQSKPNSLGDWQRMFRAIYKPSHKPDFEASFARLTEEIGELAEAIRTFPAAPGYFLSEAADVFAWLMNIQSNVDARDDVSSEHYGLALETSLCCVYPDYCRDCGNGICTCPPILPSHIGRLAHESPVEPGLFSGTELYQAKNPLRP